MAYFLTLSTATKPWPHCDRIVLGLHDDRAETLSTATKPWPHCDHHYEARVRRAQVLSTATKPWPHCDTRFPPGGFASAWALHGYKAVAPLRLPCRHLPRRRPQALHGYKAVAPLRHCEWVPSILRACYTLSTATKPWPHCDERVEPLDLGGSPLSTATKPWPHCDIYFYELQGYIQGSLHGYKAVAPLRLGGPFRPRWASGGLSTATKPWPHCDQRVVFDLDRRVFALHGYKAVAPLRLEQQRHTSGGSQLSTATKPWPHCDGRSMW